MKKTILILGFILALSVIIILYMKNNIQKNISGSVIGFNVIKAYDLLAPKVDFSVVFKIINNSKFSFRISNFKVKVFDVISNTLLTENEVISTLEIPKGESQHNTELLGNEVLGNLSEFLNSNGKQLRIEISFKAFLVNVKFEQLITI